VIPTKEKGSLDQEDRRDRERRRKEGGRRKKGRRSMKIKKGQRDNKPEKDFLGFHTLRVGQEEKKTWPLGDFWG